jgi:hypothetical protein
MQIHAMRLPTRACLAALLALSVASPAHAQLGDVLKRGRGAIDRMPSLSSFLEGEPPVTTSLDDALTEVPWLDGYDPSFLLPLEGFPMDAEGRFRLIPGAYAFAAQSYCLKAGTHGPGGGDGYAYAPLAGPKSTIVRKILRGSAAHPEIPQHDVQVLLWAIIARTKPSDMPREMRLTAARLLTPQEIAQLEGGALGLVPEPLMRRAMAELPPFAREVFEAEARIRSMLSQANASYADLERVAVLAGAPPPDPEGRLVPERRWSYHPDGYFIRFDPSGYSRTTIHLIVPAAFTIERDQDGSVSGVADPLGNRLEVERGGAGVPGAFRLLRPDDLEPEVMWPAAPDGGDPDGATRWSAMLEGVFKRPDADLGVLVDLARLEAAIGGQDGPSVAAGQARQMVVEAWMSEFCRQAGGCASAGAPSGGGRAGGAGWRRDEPRIFDPSGTVGVPGNRARQRLGQSPRCNGDDPTGDDGGGPGTDDAIEQGLVEGMQAAGVANFSADHIIVTQTNDNFWKFFIRLDENGCPLPEGACIFDAIDRGEVPPGSQVGAKTLLLGAVHIAGSVTRVNGRFVRTETGEIIDSRRADAGGNDAAAVAEAAAQVFRDLVMTCDRAKGLLDQHTR